MNMCNIPDYLIQKESYKDEKMTKSEAINLSLSVGIVLQDK